MEEAAGPQIWVSLKAVHQRLGAPFSYDNVQECMENWASLDLLVPNASYDHCRFLELDPVTGFPAPRKVKLPPHPDARSARLNGSVFMLSDSEDEVVAGVQAGLQAARPSADQACITASDSDEEPQETAGTFGKASATQATWLPARAFANWRPSWETVAAEEERPGTLPADSGVTFPAAVAARAVSKSGRKGSGRKGLDMEGEVGKQGGGGGGGRRLGV